MQSVGVSRFCFVLALTSWRPVPDRLVNSAKFFQLVPYLSFQENINSVLSSTSCLPMLGMSGSASRVEAACRFVLAALLF